MAQLAKAISITEVKAATVSFMPYSLRLIDDHLWCLGAGGISIFDLALNYVRDMELPGMDWVYGAVDVGDGAVVAAVNGLFFITYTGMVRDRHVYRRSNGMLRNIV